MRLDKALSLVETLLDPQSRYKDGLKVKTFGLQKMQKEFLPEILNLKAEPPSDTAAFNPLPRELPANSAALGRQTAHH